MKRIFTTLIIAGACMLNSTQTQAQCYSAVELDGVDDYLHTTFNNYNFVNYTIEMWFNSANYNPVEMYVHFNQNSQVALGSNQSTTSFFSGGTGLTPNLVTSGTGTLPASGTWHHVAVVYDGADQLFYLDGALISTTPTSGSLTQGSGTNFGLAIGARFDGSQQFANASFEDVRIWTVARSSAELAANMSSNLVGNESGLVAYYRFEDGAGSSTVTDLTGNGNTLSLMNMDPTTDWVTGPFSVDAQSTDVQVACGSLTWIDGVTYTSDNNTATFTYPGAAAGGCDSIVTLDLTINTAVDTSVTTTSPVITSNDVGVGSQFQWLDCNNGFSMIPGETGQSFTATTTGAYAVMISGANGCTDTSECVAIEFASLNESNLETGISVSPNPTEGVISISAVNYSGEVNIDVMDLTGKLIFSSKENLSTNALANIDLSQAENGMYIVNVSDLKETHSIRIVKK